MKNSNPHILAREGLGWEDLRVMCGITEAEAKLIVFGRQEKLKQLQGSMKETG